MRERDLYPDVAAWLEGWLARFGRATAAVTASEPLNRWLERWGVASSIPFSGALDIEVDVAGVLFPRRKTEPELYLVEVKLGPVNLQALSQLLGYCVVARPAGAWLLSPKGWTPSIGRLIRHFGRRDILDFGTGTVVIARWDVHSRSVRPGDRLYP